MCRGKQNTGPRVMFSHVEKQKSWKGGEQADTLKRTQNMTI